MLLPHALCALLACLPAQAPVAAEAVRDISPLLRKVREEHDVPGLVGAIVRGDQLVAQGVDGLRKLGAATPITASDQMHLGSCTKAMTATLVALFVEEGKLKWETKLGEVFPTAPMKPAWKDVTLEMLLTHRSGAPAELDAEGLWGKLWERKGTPTEQRRQLFEGVTSREPVSTPGTKYLYSNAGVAIAGYALETISKKSWEELMQERLFKPLGIRSAGFGAPGTPGKVDQPPDQPRGHRGGTAIEPGPAADNPPAIGPAGTVHMSVPDWAKFVALHLRGERGGTKLLKPESFVRLHKPLVDGETHYAMGWSVQERDWAGGRVLTHNGSNTMWFCVTWIAPEKDFAVLVACNQGGDKASTACDRAAWALIQDELERRPVEAK